VGNPPGVTALSDRRIHDPVRLAVLAATGLLDRPRVPGLDRLTRLAARLLRVPTAAVSLVSSDRQVFTSQIGMAQPWAAIGETPLEYSFCQFVVDDDVPLVVADARGDARLKDNRAVGDLGVIAYAGMPIRVAGQTLGAFCAIDGRPRDWSAPDLAVLEDLAAAVASEISLIRAADDAEQKADTIRAILNVSHDAYVAIDLQGRVLEWNPAAEVLFGWSRGEVTGRDLAGLIVPEELRAAHRAGLARVRTSGVSELAGRRIELTGIDRNGRTFPVELTLQATDVRETQSFHAFLHDISDRRDAEEQLRRQAELIDAAPAAIIVRSTDGTILAWNRGAEQMYGWPAHAALGRNIHLLLATEFPKGRPEVEQELADTGRWHGEMTHRRSDGRPVVVLSQHVIRPACGGSGYEVVETNTDITERRQAEEALEASERQFRVQFHQSTIGQSILGLDGRLLVVNEAYANMLGRTADELVGMHIEGLTCPGDRAEDTRLRAGLFAGDFESYERTKGQLRPDGNRVEVRVGVRLVRDADGAPVHLLGVIENNTDQVRAQRERDTAHEALVERNDQLADTNRQLEEANLLKLDLMGMLSHDIGTPLASILGYSEILVAREDTSAPQLKKIMKAAQRIDQLRQDVLSMCSVDSGSITTEREPVELAPALREAVEAADMAVPVDCPAALQVLVNPAHLQQIIVNFLTNAAKYGDGATGIDVRTAGTRVAIAVRDEGSGVPPGLRDHLFERFTRAGNTTATGHGLGLHIVASLAEANGGTVTHHDNVPRGSVFTLVLPISA
jgi:PAS domain S-box-containing protein